MIVIQAATGTSVVQYWIINAAAVTSEAINIEYEYLFAVLGWFCLLNLCMFISHQ